MAAPAPAVAAAAARPLNLLFLHGYTQSASLFRSKTRVLEKHLAKHLPAPYTSVNAVYAQGPLRLLPSEMPGTPPANPDEEDENSNSWAWWRKREATGEYVGIEKTWEYLRKVLDEEGPFEGVVGFSQGATLAGMLASALEEGRGNGRPKELEGCSHPPLKFAIAYAGFAPPKETNNGTIWALFEPKIQTPIMHFVGTLDYVVVEARTEGYIRQCERAEVVRYPGGHFVPLGKQFLGAVGGWIEKAARGEAGVKTKEEEEAEWEDLEEGKFGF